MPATLLVQEQCRRSVATDLAKVLSAALSGGSRKVLSGQSPQRHIRIIGPYFVSAGNGMKCKGVTASPGLGSLKDTQVIADVCPLEMQVIYEKDGAIELFAKGSTKLSNN